MRMKSLATQARSDALTDTERGYLNEEFSEMQSQIDFISSSTKFNDTAVIGGDLGATLTSTAALDGSGTLEASGSSEGFYNVEINGGLLQVQKLDGTGGSVVASQSIQLDGTNDNFTGNVKLQDVGFSFDFSGHDLTTDVASEEVEVGGNAAIFQVGVAAGTDDITVDVAETNSTTLNVDSATININTIAEADTASDNLDIAIETVNTERAQLGANMSRMEKINDNLATTTENLDAARSTLMDVDVAAEMTEFSKNQVMTQASTAMLAQANQLPQNLMRLLQ